ncbi:hypothetical protein [Pedobacter agri]|uniref:hypothetical protein n=1 Tax=Pedobacter agri TaxID=454586 RepID=UPI00292D270E|nr:hypothetical protein [Pedobacter agri]
MKIKFYLFFCFLLLTGENLYSQSSRFKWEEKEKLEKINNLQDSAKWDYEMLQKDMSQKRPRLEREGMDFGIFPVPKYTQGLGTGANINLNYFGKKIFWNYFFSEKNGVNEQYLGDKNSEVFFAVVILTDSLNTSPDKNNVSYNVVSRNYPDKLASGVLKTKNNSIEYISFLTGDRKQFALINLRLFDLDQGRLVLIAPQKDGSLRSMQLLLPIMEYEDINEYIALVLKENKVKSFFLNNGNI